MRPRRYASKKARMASKALAGAEGAGLKLIRFREHRTFVFEKSAMAKTRPPYPPEFRRQMVKLVRAGRGGSSYTAAGRAARLN
jgi:hypothetical protein